MHLSWPGQDTTELTLEPGVGARAEPSRLQAPRWPRLSLRAANLAGWAVPSVIVPFLITRAAILLVAEVASISIPHLVGSGPAAPPDSVPWFSPLLKWDAGWYLDIAANWYRYQPQLASDVDQSVAFFPLYPLLIRVWNGAFGGSAALLPTSALIVANLAALLGLGLLYRLVLSEFGAPVARRAVWYVTVFPTSFILSAAYAESVFLAAAVAAMYSARSNRWVLAGLSGAAASLARPYGVLIAVPLAVEYARQNWADRRLALRAEVLSLLLPPLALGGWMAYLYTLSGDPLVFVHSQAAWEQQHLTSPIDTLLAAYARARDQQLQGRVDMTSLQFLIGSVAAGAAVLTWRTLPVAYAAFATVFCAIVLSSGSTAAIWRHILPIFPLFVLAARAGSSSIFDRAYLSLALTGSGLFVTLLATAWQWVS